MNVRFVEINSSEYASLCDLRYRVFFQDRGFPRTVMFDEHENHSWYVVVTEPSSSNVVACGRLTARTATEFQISQMAVDPNWQGKKLGSAMMTALLEKSVHLGATSVMLDARSSAIGFYERFGFRVISDEFPSAKTGTPHVLLCKVIESSQAES